MRKTWEVETGQRIFRHLPQVIHGSQNTRWMDLYFGWTRWIPTGIILRTVGLKETRFLCGWISRSVPKMPSKACQSLLRLMQSLYLMGTRQSVLPRMNPIISARLISILEMCMCLWSLRVRVWGWGHPTVQWGGLWMSRLRQGWSLILMSTMCCSS